MTEQEWDELYPNGTREWSTRRMPKEHLQAMKHIVAIKEISLSETHAKALGIGLEVWMQEILAGE